MKLYFIFLIILLPVLVVAQHGVDRATVKKWKKEDARLKKSIDSLRSAAEVAQRGLVRYADSLAAVQRRYNRVMGSVKTHQDTSLSGPLERRIVALVDDKAVIQGHFDSLLVSIDSILGLRNAVENKIHAARKR